MYSSRRLKPTSSWPSLVTCPTPVLCMSWPCQETVHQGTEDEPAHAHPAEARVDHWAHADSLTMSAEGGAHAPVLIQTVGDR